jgi:ATP-binding cassette subfamily F protein 2
LSLHAALADCDKLPPPVLPFQNVSFSYSGNAEGMLYKDLEFGIDCDSRIALVGPNGAGGLRCAVNCSCCG